MKYLVKTKELKDKVDYIAKQIMIIDENIENLSKIKSSIVWEGVASAKFLDIYDNYISELKYIEKDLIAIDKYLSSYGESYDIGYANLIKKYDILDNKVK